MIEKLSYGGWPNCLRLADENVELIMTTDVGPRVIRYGFIGGQNLFKEFAEQMGRAGEATWQPRGGHRIWVAPEVVPDTYAPDNLPVRASVSNNRIELTQAVEPETGLEKSIAVELSPRTVTVTHRIKNVASQPRTLAPWALSMMAPGGVGITKFPPRGTHPEELPPTNPLIMWAFTDLSDPRWTFTRKYLILRQDANNASAQKLGHFNAKTMGAYLLGSDLFVKTYAADPSKTYPDFGASYETFTNGDFLELETLGPLEEVRPGATVEHVERWSLHRNIEIRGWTDAELDRVWAALQ
jgi:hypothetical protein